MVRLGIIGTGSISRDALTPAIGEVQSATLWSVLSRDKANATRFADEHGAVSSTPAYDEIDNFLSDPDLDAVVIATPDKLHAEQTIAAANAGKHVLVEKPMATNMKDLKDLIKLAKKSNKFLIAAPFVILSPVYQAIHQEITKKSIGKISSITS